MQTAPQFTVEEMAVMTNALYMAIERYRECAATCKSEPGHDRLALQFAKQIADCQALIDRLEA